MDRITVDRSGMPRFGGGSSIAWNATARRPFSRALARWSRNDAGVPVGVKLLGLHERALPQFVHGHAVTNQRQVVFDLGAVPEWKQVGP